MKVNEIFLSIEGEGKRAGLPCAFIRLFGCNLNCSYCDTRYSCDGKEYEILTKEQILETLQNKRVKNVTITGGEPLIHAGIYPLIELLVENGYQVNVETNGSIRPKRRYPSGAQLFDFRDCFQNPKVKDVGSVFYTMDWKCAGSGMSDKMNIEHVNSLTDDDVLKFVVGSKDDLNEALEVIEGMTSHPQVYFSPVYGKIEAKEIVEYLLEKRMFNCKVQLQLHKYIWDPNKRGV